MIDALRLGAGWALVWLFGIAVTASLAFALRGRARTPAHVAWTLGCGFFAGAFGVTVWMRVLSYIGLRFSVADIAGPLALATVAMGAFVWRRNALHRLVPAASRESMPRIERLLAIGLLSLLALRFALLLLDVVWTPLYPWDAWIQWATKARVWYALGQIVPFGRTDAWFAADGALFFDASPDYPATVPLWQVWSSMALGRWDDALMNLPWWLAAVAFALAIYGALRDAGFRPLFALVGAWLVSSLPLANVHVALAGYADLPMAMYLALAAISLWRWTATRARSDAALALLFAIACLTIKTPGIVWALTLVPGVVVAVAPRWAPRLLAAGIAIVVFGLLVLAQVHPVVLGYRLHLDFAPAWNSLLDSLFLLGNWNLLWYAIAATIVVGWRTLREPLLAPLSAIVGAGVLFLAVVFAFTNARAWVTDQTTINRATLHIAPLALFWMMLVVERWRRHVTAKAGVAAPAT
jgi:hypothetical protein